MLLFLVLIIFLNSLHLNLAVSYAKEGDFPHEVSIQFDSQHICGGTIISKHFIVTGAQCVYHLDFWDLSVVTGILDFEKRRVGRSDKVNCKIVHPQFEPSTRNFDVAILKVRRPFRFTTNVNYIDIMSSSFKLTDSKLATLVYWAPDPGTELMYTELEMKILEKCSPTLLWDDDGVSKETYLVNEAVFCVALPEEVCIGESGVLLVDGRLMALVSWNVGCEATNSLVILTNITYYKEWIDAKTK